MSEVSEVWSTPTHSQKLILVHGIIVESNLKFISQTENNFKTSRSNLLINCTDISDIEFDYRSKKGLFPSPFDNISLRIFIEPAGLIKVYDGYLYYL